MVGAATVDEETVAIDALGETLARLRMASEPSLRQMRRSLEDHGQLTALAVYAPDGGGLEVVDGFKRLRAARTLGLAGLRVRTVARTAVHAKLALRLLNDGAGLSELEESWLVRSLYRDDRLSQPEIGRLLCRHKSWVCRRLQVAEALDEAVQADVRLGLLSVRSAQALARLPRDNQRRAADVVVRRGLTYLQTERLVASVLACPDGPSRDRRLAEVLAGADAALSGRAAPPRERTPAEWIVADAVALTRVSGRLQARLLDTPPSTLEAAAGALAKEALRGLGPVLQALARRIDHLTSEAVPNAPFPLDHP